MVRWFRWSAIPVYLILVAFIGRVAPWPDGLVWPFLICAGLWAAGFRLTFEPRVDPDLEWRFWAIVGD